MNSDVKQVPRVLWQKAASLSCHPSRRQMQFACTGQAHSTDVGTLHTTGRHIFPSNVPLPIGDLGLHLMHGSFDQLETGLQTASRSLQPFLHSSPVCPTHRETDTQTTLRATPWVASMHCVQAMCFNKML